MTALISSVDVAISVDIRLEASASLLKSSSVPLTVFRTYANEDSKSILALTAVVPKATIGVVMCVVSVLPALVMALDRVPHFFEKFVSTVPACVHADFIRYSSSVSFLISASVSRAAAFALFRSVAALEAVSALFCMVFCRALT